ncbi:WWTR1 protein, partial [Hemiprocne comata]|nr:WWTR1 protein [Hemiprocne comata]
VLGGGLQWGRPRPLPARRDVCTGRRGTMNPAAAAPPPGQQVIHVTQDLDTELEALFNAVMNPKPSSWRKKILPESFFKEPDSGSHSRQSSTDSGGPPPRPAAAQHLQLSQRPAAAAQPEAGAWPFSSRDELWPCWEQFLSHNMRALVFYLFFLSHIEKITTWQDPRKAMNQPVNHMSHHPAAAATPVPQRPMAMSQPNLGESGCHLCVKIQKRGETPFAYLFAKLIFASRRVALILLTDLTVSPQQGRPPPAPQPGLLSLPGALTTQQQQQQQQQKLRLQRIQMERERIRMRQEELLRQEAALCRQLPMESDSLAPVQAAVSTPTMAPDMRPITNNGSDPFLNRQLFHVSIFSGPYHSREQSTDSGLGLGCYSIPTTPEDFLGNVDEMDTGETIAQTTMNINPQQTRFPDFLDCLPGTNVDLGTLESEDLIPILNDVESVLNKNEPFLTWL